MEHLSLEDEPLLGQVGWPTQGSLRLAGSSHEAVQLVRQLLQVNHVKYDWSFAEGGLHNHLSHSVLAAYSLGASPYMIQRTYDLHSRAQRPMCALRRRISYQNWTRWLGQDEYYSSYLVFFMEEIKKYGAPATVERYLFKYKDGKLLIRTVSGAIHPLIQMGHGIEFGLEALVAEGLAQACVHSPQVEALFNDGWPHNAPAPPALANNTASTFASAFSHFRSLKVPAVPSLGYQSEDFFAALQRLNPRRPRHPRLGLSAFTIISHILKDPRLAAGQANGKNDFPRLGSALKNRGDLIRAWCEEWVIDAAGGWTEIVEKMEELFWVATVLVGASSRPGYKPRMDFFMMHGLTSAIFLPSMLEVLSPNSRIQLLHSHFRVMIGYWISRGRPYLYIEETLMAANPYPHAPNAVPASEGAIERGIRKAVQEDKEKRARSQKEDKHEENQNHDATKEGHDLQDTQAESKTQDDSTLPKSDSSSQVNVSLDSPTQEKETDPLQQAEPAFPPQAKRNLLTEEEDGTRTPTQPQSQENGHVKTMFEELARRPQSSTASWADLITAAIDHTDEHVTKMTRSLLFAAQNFGAAPPGAYRSALPGTEKMDGTIFLRLAGMLFESMGWEHYGQKAAEDWDRSVLGFDEAWQDETRDILASTSSAQSAEPASQEGSSATAKRSDSVSSQDFRPEAYTIGSHNRGRSGSIFDRKEEYPRKVDKGKGRAVEPGMPVYEEEAISEQEKLQRRYYQDDESDPNAFGEHQQWAEGVV